MSGYPLQLAVAGINFELHSPAPDWLATLHDRYRLFAAPATPDWVVTLQVDRDLQRADPPWANHEETRTTFHVSSSRGEINLANNSAEVYAPSALYAPSAMDRVLSFICTYDLPRRHDGLLVHGAALVRRGHGLALSGRSGAGKTTASRVALGHAQVLTDENLVLSLAGPQPMLLSTPFWGASTPPEMIQRVNVQAPLRALLLIEHGSEFRLERLNGSDAIMALLTTEKMAVERVSSAAAWLAIAQRLVAATPTYRLASRPTAELWPFLDRELGL